MRPVVVAAKTGQSNLPFGRQGCAGLSPRPTSQHPEPSRGAPTSGAGGVSAVHVVSGLGHLGKRQAWEDWPEEVPSAEVDDPAPPTLG